MWLMFFSFLTKAKRNEEIIYIIITCDTKHLVSENKFRSNLLDKNTTLISEIHLCLYFNLGHNIVFTSGEITIGNVIYVLASNQEQMLISKK